MEIKKLQREIRILTAANNDLKDYVSNLEERLMESLHERFLDEYVCFYLRIRKSENPDITVSELIDFLINKLSKE